jgi:hypothetical protein
MKSNISKFRIALFFMLLLFSSCSFSNEKQNQQKNAQTSNNIDFIKQAEKERKYYFENDTIKQSITITKNTDTQIDFLYEIRNKKRDCFVTYSGIALNEYPDNDPELDEDEEGFGYPVIEYVYDNENGIIGIRLSMIEKDKIQILSDCNQHTFCPINSMGILRSVTE